MPIPLPNLDDRRWTDLVEESRALIPIYAPEWTDHNPSDPGITLLELTAWVAEMDLYKLNRVTDHQRLRMLAMAGVRPQPPQPARCVLRFDALGPAAAKVAAGTLCSGLNRSGQLVQYRTLAAAEAPVSSSVEVQAEQSTPSVALSHHVRTGDGGAFQTVPLSGIPIVENSVRIYTTEGGVQMPWERRDDLAASTPASRHFLLNPTTGEVAFGDGNHGRVPPLGAAISASHLTTSAAAGRVDAHAIRTIGDEALAALATVDNPEPSTGGTDAETLADAIARVRTLREAQLRAVTLSDIEAIARQTPGVKLDRVSSRANHYPGLDCVMALGVTTVLVLPATAAILQKVHSHLNRRRILGSRIEVIGPTIVKVSATAKVRAFPGVSRDAVKVRIGAALDAFLDPVGGGPDRTGWPFGRDVYRSEILQLIDGVEGVDSVLSLVLSAGSQPPACGNLCIPATGAASAAPHRIEVVS